MGKNLVLVAVLGLVIGGASVARAEKSAEIRFKELSALPAEERIGPRDITSPNSDNLIIRVEKVVGEQTIFGFITYKIRGEACDMNVSSSGHTSYRCYN